MNTNDNKCKQFETAMDYVYAELSHVNAKRFQLHLADCDECTEVVRSSHLVRTAVMTWRKEDFDHLPTPSINISYEDPRPVELSNGLGWFSNIFGTFNLRLACGLIAAALIAIVAFVYFDGISEDKNDIAANIRSIETHTSKNAQENIAGSDNSTADTTITNNNGSIEPEPKAINIKARQIKNTIPVIIPTVKRSNANSIPKSSMAKRLPSPRSSKPLPTLGGDEPVTDDSLRLADLFDDTDTIN